VIIVAEKLKKIECDPNCGFMVRSHDEKEIIEITTQHAKKSHNMTITEKDVRDMLKTA
jgi:predicted small metal-binding protein